MQHLVIDVDIGLALDYPTYIIDTDSHSLTRPAKSRQIIQNIHSSQFTKCLAVMSWGCLPSLAGPGPARHIVFAYYRVLNYGVLLYG